MTASLPREGAEIETLRPSWDGSENLLETLKRSDHTLQDLARHLEDYSKRTPIKGVVPKDIHDPELEVFNEALKRDLALRFSKKGRLGNSAALAMLQEGFEKTVPTPLREIKMAGYRYRKMGLDNGTYLEDSVTTYETVQISDDLELLMSALKRGLDGNPYPELIQYVDRNEWEELKTSLLFYLSEIAEKMQAWSSNKSSEPEVKRVLELTNKRNPGLFGGDLLRKAGHYFEVRRAAVIELAKDFTVILEKNPIPDFKSLKDYFAGIASLSEAPGEAPEVISAKVKVSAKETMKCK